MSSRPKPAAATDAAAGVIADRSLSELIQDQLVLFTPAIPYLTIPFDEDPLEVYQCDRKLDCYVVTNQRQFFNGLDLPPSSAVKSIVAWDHTLLAMPAEQWTGFAQWFGTCAYYSAKSGLVRRIRTQELSVADPLSGIEAQKAPVTAFVVETNKGSFYFYELGCTGSGLYAPKFDRTAKFRDTELFAEAINLGESDPYAFIKAREQSDAS